MERIYFDIAGFVRGSISNPSSSTHISTAYIQLPQPVETVSLPHGIINLHFSMGQVYQCYFTPDRDEHGDIIHDDEGHTIGKYKNTAVTSSRMVARAVFYDKSENEISSIYIANRTASPQYTIDMTTAVLIGAVYCRIEIHNYYSERLIAGLPSDGTAVDYNTSSLYAVAAPQYSGYYEYQPWKHDENENLYNESVPETRENPIVKPIPKGLWRIDGNILWHELLLDVHGFDMWSMPPERKIKVYSMWEKQDGFKHNGLAVLDPISCHSFQAEKGRWDITLVHPLDDWGKWRYLIPQNIIKANGQLFRIDTNQPKINSSERTVTVTANQIFYDLSRDIILLKEIPEENRGGWYPQKLLRWIMTNGVITSERAEHPEAYKDFNIYDFEYSTDLSDDNTTEFDGFTNTTLTAALIGDSKCFVNLFGGELYRNNFYFSINKRMENARENAFSLRYSFDLQEIEFSIDYTDFMTRLEFIDMNGNWSGTQLWNDTTTTYSVPSPVVRAVKFNAPLSDEIRENYFQSVAYPKYTYKIKMANIKDDPRYRDFQNLHDIRLGDKGTVYCEPLDVETVQKVIEIERDELSLEIISITLGDSTKYVGGFNPYRGITTSGNSPTDLQAQALQEEIKNSTLKSMKRWSGISSYSWQEIIYKWGEIND